MRFLIPVKNTVHLSIAAAHGVVDITKPPRALAIYALALVPFNTHISTAAFAAASLVHFGHDITLMGSAALHALFLVTVARLDMAHAARLVLGYMCYFHIPLLVARLCMRGAVVELVWLAACSSLAIKYREKIVKDGHFDFGPRLQRLIICHTVLSFLV